MDSMRAHPPAAGHRASLVAVFLALGLTAAACSGGGTEVSATGDPASATGDTTTTAAETATTAEPATTTAPAPPASVDVTTTTVTVPVVASCPEQSGDPVRYEAVLKELPDGLGVGDEFYCGRVYDMVSYEVPRSRVLIYIYVWDEADFLRRTEADSNVESATPVRQTEAG